MKSVSIHDAKTNLSKYIAAAKRGEKIFIGSYGQPEVELTIARPASKRTVGVLKGKLTTDEEDQLLTYDKHQDLEWQGLVDDMYRKPIGE